MRIEAARQLRESCEKAATCVKSQPGHASRLPLEEPSESDALLQDDDGETAAMAWKHTQIDWELWLSGAPNPGVELRNRSMTGAGLVMEPGPIANPRLTTELVSSYSSPGRSRGKRSFFQQHHGEPLRSEFLIGAYFFGNLQTVPLTASHGPVVLPCLRWALRCKALRRQRCTCDDALLRP
jgi:hypothetical protein